MRIKLKYPDVETFIQKYAVNISRGGIFIATKQPKPVGTPLKFEFLLAMGEVAQSIIRGEGQVLWTREFDPDQPTKAHGMGVRFTKLDAESQAIIDRALAFRGSGVMPLPPTPTQMRQAPTGPPQPFGPPATPPAPPPTPPAPPPLIPEMRRPVDETKPVTLPAGGDSQPIAAQEARPPARARDEATKPITMPEAEAEVRAMREEPHTGETTLPVPRVNLSVERDPSREIRVRGEITDDLDALARDWGISDEQIERVLKRARPRMVEATAELERLLRKPSKGPAPTRAEAVAGLKELLERGSPVLEIAVDPARKRAR